MLSIALVSLVAVTSLAAYAIGIGALKLPASHLRHAAPRTLETVGFAAVFFAVNVLGWVIGVLGARAIFGWFVSMYLFSGVTIGMLSLLQGVMFQRWWESSSGVRRSSPRA